MGGRAKYSGLVSFCGVITVDGDVFDMDISFDLAGEPHNETVRKLTINGVDAVAAGVPWSRHLRGRLRGVEWDLGSLVLLEIGGANDEGNEGYG